MNKNITHFTWKSHWEAALKKGAYLPHDFDKDGFMHCSTMEQVVETANRYAAGDTNIVLLVIDPNLLLSPLKYEARPSTGEMYPHIYGELNLDAVIEVHDFPWSDKGTFVLPF